MFFFFCCYVLIVPGLEHKVKDGNDRKPVDVIHQSGMCVLLSAIIVVQELEKVLTVG